LKIGYSSRGLRRVAEQSTAFPETPKVEFVIHSKKAKSIEERIHRALSHAQADVMGVEWFDVSMHDVVMVSPELQKALGIANRKRWLVRMWSVLALVLAVWVYPLACVVVLGPFSGWAPSEGFAVMFDYLRETAALNASAVMGLWMAIASSFAQSASFGVMATLGALLGLPAVLPGVLKRS